MEKKELTSGTVKLTGLKMVAERVVQSPTLTYKPYGNYANGMDLNQQVYELMIIAAYDQLKMGQAVFKGDYTAAEMAGTFGGMHQFCENVSEEWEHYRLVVIRTKSFQCSFHPGEAFAQMAEWEGVMNMAPKKYHRFAVEGKERPKDAKIEPYKRCHGCRPTTVSLAAENTRIAKKFDVIGAMSEDLGSEGMKRALSVLTATKSIEKLYGYQMGELAERLLRRKLWREYGKRERLHRREAWLTDEMKRSNHIDRYKSMKKDLDEVRKKLSAPVSPVCYSARDFEHGPEVWKVVDEAYVTELIAYFRQVLADSPAPKWPAKGDMVILKDQEKQCKKWQGKLSVYEVRGQLDTYQDKISWYAVVCTTKGQHDSMTREVDALEPWTEPEKPKKKKAVSKKEKTTAKATPEPCTVNPEPTLEDRLRAALRKQFAMAA